jgi:hypothetical protein
VIELHVRDRRTPLDMDVEATLLDLVLAHRVVVAGDAVVPVPLPAVREGDRWFGPSEIPDYVDDLHRLTRDWRRFQSDACYIDEDGANC